MDSDYEDLAFVVTMFTWWKNRKNKRRLWVRPFLNNRNNVVSILCELKVEDRFGFKNFLRMSEEDFNLLLTIISPIITKRDTNFRAAIPPQLRLGLTLRFLATGDSYTSLMYLVKVSKQQISKIIPEVCDAIILSLMKDYMKGRLTEVEWQEKQEGFKIRWNFPHCVGALDGKHVVLQAPANTGSLYFNYKQTFSIVLLAMVDAFYNFVFVDVGCQGRISDGGVFRNTTLYDGLENNTLNFPQDEPLPGRENPVPYIIVADDAFPLTTRILKPYSGTYEKGSRERIFNYRLSRSRNVVENTFGILCSVFRVFRKPLAVGVKRAISLTLASTVLHNFLRRNAATRSTYSPPGSFDSEDTETGITIPGAWRGEGEVLGIRPLPRFPRRNTLSAKEVRDEFANYFTSDRGSVPWQNNLA